MVASRGDRFFPDQETANIISGETVTQDFVLLTKGTTSLERARIDKPSRQAQDSPYPQRTHRCWLRNSPTPAAM
jgi:hypothetical protein